MSDANLDSIPVELLSMILAKLPTADQISGRLVCKKFRFVLENNVKVRRLIVSLNEKICAGKWYQTYRPFDLSDLIRAKDLDFLQNEPFKKMFARLRMLYVYDFPERLPLYNLASLNTLQELEHLELWFLRVENQSKLTLPNLKVFCVNEHTSANLIIDTESLIHFKTVFELRQLTFPRVTSIRSVQCHKLTREILAFENLERLCCYLIPAPLDSELLARLPTLNRIQFYDLDSSYQTLKLQKRRLNRRDLKIFFLGINFEQTNDGRTQEIELSDHNLTFSRHHLNDQNLALYFDHYDRLDDRLPFVNCVDYASLEARFGSFDNMPADFFERFPIIKTVHAKTRIANQESFWTFLSGCSSIHTLWLKNSGLDQAYFDRLPAVCGSVGTLNIMEDLKNFDFILELENLIDLELDANDPKKTIPLDLIRQAFSQLKHLEAITFTLDQHVVYLGREEFGYEIDVNDLMSTYKNSLDDVIEFLENKDYECF